MNPDERGDRRSLLERAAFAALWLLVFVIPLENVVIPGIGLLSIVVGMIAAGICVLAIAERGSIRPLNVGHGLMGLFVVWVALSCMWTVDREATAVQLTVYLRLLLMVWLIWQLASDSGQPIGLLNAYVFGTFAAGLDTIGEFLRQNEAVYQRYAGAGANPDDLGLMAALSVPIAYCFFIHGHGRTRWLYAAQIALAATTILLSATRGAALAMAVGLLIVPATAARLKSRQMVAIVLTAALIVAIGVFFAPASSRERLATIPEELAGGSLSGRTSIWAAGVELFREHPWIGVGAGAYRHAVREVLIVGEVAHNTFLSIVVELGVVGLGIFCALLGVLFICATELPWLPKRLWLVCAAVWLLGISNLTWEMRKPTWLFFGLLLAQHASVRPLVVRPMFVGPQLQPAQSEHSA